MHVHNLLNWRSHLKTLRELKEQGLVRYIGVTTSHGRRHDEMLDILRREPLDAIQITYSVADDSAEPVLAAAAERGIAVIANRPFDGGALVDRANRLPLPGWARDDRLRALVAGAAEVDRLAPGGGLRDPGHDQPGAHGRKTWRRHVAVMPDAAMRRRIAEHLRRSL